MGLDPVPPRLKVVDSVLGEFILTNAGPWPYYTTPAPATCHYRWCGEYDYDVPGSLYGSGRINLAMLVHQPSSAVSNFWLRIFATMPTPGASAIGCGGAKTHGATSGGWCDPAHWLLDWGNPVSRPADLDDFTPAAFSGPLPPAGSWTATQNYSRRGTHPGYELGHFFGQPSCVFYNRVVNYVVTPLYDEPEYPPLATQAGNLLGSTARFIASGGATVSQEEYDRRRAICLACPTRRYVAAQDRCEACGCYLSVKPWGKAESCPDGHW